MNVLTLAFYGEGRTDYRFLLQVIKRTAEQILNGLDVEVYDVYEVHLENDNKERAACILQAALDAQKLDALIVHADADHPNAEIAKIDRFDPGYKLFQQSIEPRCKHMLPIIPVQAIEAWMLADYKLLLQVIGTDKDADDFDILPKKAKLVESISKPKERLKAIVREAYKDRPRRRRQKDIDISFLYLPLGERIDLHRLEEVSSYQQFTQDLRKTLEALNMIHT